ncbi:thiamine phosphate synthase [Clostridium ihumii]|uniref:thiamine phosphate synthase n=1 Tax=Clostridium ihumii TaxID=1470356 RepID=UPI00058B6EBD|nr:thiamine phosphate synthase [Clostridium ihumii]
MNKIDYSLYLVTDRNILKNRDLKDEVENAIKGGVTLVQLREKECGGKDFLEYAIEVKEITDKYNVPLIINDRVDIALAIDAAGVHVGQNDIPAKVVRELIGKNKVLGISVSNLEEAKKAVEDGADYLGIGAIYSTSTKKDAKNVKLNMLKEIRDNIKIPIVAIGGIDKNNAKEVIECNIDGIAVVSAILSENDIELAAKNLKSFFIK